MTIPSSFADYMLAFHRVKTWKDIFKYAGLNVVSTWHTVSGRRTFIKHPGRCAFAGRDRLLKNLVVVPKL